MSFFRNAAGLVLTSAVVLPIEIVISILLARFLAVDERGLYALGTAFAALASLLALFGWPSASIYRLRRLKSDPAQVAGAALIATGVFSAILVTASVAAEPWISERFLGGAPPILLHLVSVTFPLMMLANVFGGIARGMDRFALHNRYRVGMKIFQLVVFSTVLVGLAGGLVEVLVALIVVEGVSVLVFLVAVLRITGVSLRPDWRELAGGMRFGVKSYAQTLAGRIFERVDIFMIAALLRDAEQVAFYTIAANVVRRINKIPDSVGVAAYPQLAGLAPQNAARFACRLTRQAFVLAAAGSVFLATVAPLLLPLLFGEPYRASIMPLWVLLPGASLLALYRVLGRYFMAINRQQTTLLTQVFSLGVNVGLNYWMIPRYGVAGAAAATSVAYAVQTVFISVVFLTMTGQGVGELLLLRRSDLDAYRKRLDRLWKRIRPTR